MTRNLEIGKICFVVDPKNGPVPAVIEELVERKTRNGSEFFYVFLIGPQNHRKKITEKELQNTTIISTIEEVRDFLLEGAKEWVDSQCISAEQKATAWYQDLLVESDLDSLTHEDSSSVIEEILKKEEEIKQEEVPEVKITRPRGRPSKKGNSE
jgi:hypothetical protein